MRHACRMMLPREWVLEVLELAPEVLQLDLELVLELVLDLLELVLENRTPLALAPRDSPRTSRVQRYGCRATVSFGF